MAQPAMVQADEAGASLLARTPALIRELRNPQRESKDWNDLRLQLENRLYGLRSWRMSWWQHWGRIAEALLPRRFHWLIVPNSYVRGLAINGQITDPTGTQALRICAAGMKTGLMSSARPWFKLKPGLRNFKVDRDAQLWYDLVEERIYQVLAASNFYDAGTQMFEDLASFGTAPQLIYGDKQSIIRCYNPVAGEYYLGNGSDFRVNSFYRTFNMTTVQIVERFGIKNVGPEVQGLWEQKGAQLETEFIIGHAIEPNFSLQAPGMGDSKLGVIKGGFPWREYYWLYGKETPGPLQAKGYREQPFLAPRWATTSNDAYGRSPGMDALPDILQLHQMTRRQAEAIEKLVRPPMQADVGLKNQPSSILPGRITYVTDVSKGGMKPIYTVDPHINEMTQLIEKIEARVQKWFFNDQFQYIRDMEGVQPRNELEILERRAESLQVLGPVVDKYENEYAAPAIRRVVSIMMRRGLIPPKPESLMEVPTEIEFISMLAIAQRAAGTAVMEKVAGMAAQMSAAYPETPPLDNINPDTFLREYADRLGSFPNKVLRGEEEVDKMRQQRMAQMQKQLQAANTNQALTNTLPAVAGAAKDLSEVDVGGGLNASGIAAGTLNPTLQ